MAIVRDLIINALREIGAYSAIDVPQAEDAQAALLYLQMQIDAWNAERETLIIQARVPYVIQAGTSYITIGPGGDINVDRPTWLDNVTYVNPGSSPEIEVLMGIMDDDMYAAMRIKSLPSALPLQCYYQVGPVTGELYFWPQVTQNIKIYVYYLAGPNRPTSIDDVLNGPSGYHEAFHYQLAERLLAPFAVKDPSIISLVTTHSERSLARMKRPNSQPGQMGVDAAVIGGQGGYNVLADSYSGGGR